MVTKKMLLAMLCDLSDELDCLYDDIKEIRYRLEKQKPTKAVENADKTKRKPGRPRKNK